MDADSDCHVAGVVRGYSGFGFAAIAVVDLTSF
ncbi:hypothetical protein MUS1_02160 [Marinomonas ushuaiensis DSM 15871]|uniref:Uncharacterized protein n=1 Tax=Marinomonas ushuaiensis DSM 15871 TaxID=1122207 RepID=X7E9Y7_9GAMM|nr:hypothetical protein MUS1_02160 [Marinomonas ushuaiensis DSM 15871]